LFGLHSLRSGGASQAANNNVTDRLFKAHGRWRSENANDGYVKDTLLLILLIVHLWCSNIPASPAYGVYIPQWIPYARTSSNYSDFLKRHLHLRNRLLDQGYKRFSQAANNNVTDRLFKAHGRWRSENANDGYVKDTLLSKLSVTKLLSIQNMSI
jgi:hypothetical protein